MNKQSFKSEIFSLALPFMVQNIFNNSFSFIDILMISKLGDVTISAVAVVGQLSFVLGMILGSISGITVYITQFFGVDDWNNARKAFVLMIQSSVVVSIIVFVFIQLFKVDILNLLSNDPNVIKNASLYLEIIVWVFLIQSVQSSFTNALSAIGKVKLTVIVNFIGMVCNTSLNYVLIYGKFGFPNMGIQGAAIASLVSMLVSMIILIGYVYKKKYYFNISLKNIMEFDITFTRKIYKRITPLVFHEIFWATGNVLYTMVFSYMGVAAMTSFQLGKTFLNYIMIGVYGFANAANIMVGKQLARSEEDAIEYAKKFTKITIVSAFVIGILYVAVSPSLLKLFTGISEETKGYLQKIMYIQACVIIFYFLNNIWIVGVFRPGGDNKFTMKMIFVTTWLIALPLTFLGGAVFKWSPVIVYFLFSVEEISKAIIGYLRYKSKRWAVNLTKEIQK